MEKIALSAELFIKRKLNPIVDFCSGLIYRAMGFPPENFTVLFFIPRMAGYLANRRESLDEPDAKIMRQQQVYVGERLRHYTPVRERSVSGNTDKLSQVAVSNAFPEAPGWIRSSDLQEIHTELLPNDANDHTKWHQQ